MVPLEGASPRVIPPCCLNKLVSLRSWAIVVHVQVRHCSTSWASFHINEPPSANGTFCSFWSRERAFFGRRSEEVPVPPPPGHGICWVCCGVTTCQWCVQPSWSAIIIVTAPSHLHSSSFTRAHEPSPCPKPSTPLLLPAQISRPLAPKDTQSKPSKQILLINYWLLTRTNKMVHYVSVY